MKARNQLGVNMIGLIVWSVLAVVIMGGVVALFASTSQQTAVGAEQNQQQQSILNALNRTSRDVAISNPIVYASNKDIVLDVTVEDGSVERRRYYLNESEKKVWEYSKKVNRGDSYDVAAIDSYWNKPDVQRKSATVYGVDTSVLPTVPFLKYYDSDGSDMGAVARSTSAETEAIARVDISLTATVANKGSVSLSTSAVPRATTNLGATATPILASCPAFTATKDGDNVILRWDSVDGATSYEVTRNGITLLPTSPVTDPAQKKYAFTDSPGQSREVLRYMLKVVSPAGISNCIDSLQSIIVTPGATQITSELLPPTTKDNAQNPISTAWSNSSEKTTVELKWQKVNIATGYVIYKQKLDASGTPQGERQVVVTLEDYPYVDLNNDTPAPDNLSYKASAEWDEHWEWSIKVLSRTGDNDSTEPTRTLSYPNPVTDASISAVPLTGTDRVSDSDIAAGRGNNKITWTYTAGMEARGFDIYRSAIDTPAANFPAGFTKLASVDTGVNEYFDRNAAFGSTYGYYVVAKNKSGFSNSYMSKRVQQLQFPPDPVMTGVGVSGSRDLTDGTNRVMWSAAKSASGYHVFRTNIANGSQSCLTGDCTVSTSSLTATSYSDSSSVITPATRFRYIAYAYNATGLSPKLANAVTLTQRPVAPTLSKTASPTLDTTATTTSWNATAGAWCVSGPYAPSSTNQDRNCEYEQTQYTKSGALKFTGSSYATSFNWGNQEWGKNYSYLVRARNAAITNSGWSEYSGRVYAETYPAPISTSIWNGNASSGERQRVNYDSSVDNGGWGNVRREGKTTLSIGDAYGSGRIDIYRVADRWQATSDDASLLLPPWSQPYGYWSNDDGTKITARTWSLIAAPGTTYRYDLTATSIENSLQRTVSTGNTITPADVPMKGAVQSVCYGAGNGDGTGYQDHPGQLVAARLAYADLRSRYGYYEHTAVEKLYNPWRDGRIWGNGWVGVLPGGGNGITSTDGRGYFRGITDGFQAANRAEGRSESAMIGFFTNTAIYTFDGCPRSGGVMQEPGDACYVSTFAGCTALNPDQRPKWLSR